MTQATSNFAAARQIVEAKVKESPDDAPRRALLGLTYARLTRCDDARREGNRAVELLPETRDAFDGPILAVSKARIAAMCGDSGTAQTILEHSLTVPAGIILAELRLDPSWDPLRENPRFRELVAGATKH